MRLSSNANAIPDRLAALPASRTHEKLPVASGARGVPSTADEVAVAGARAHVSSTAADSVGAVTRAERRVKGKRALLPRLCRWLIQVIRPALEPHTFGEDSLKLHCGPATARHVLDSANILRRRGCNETVRCCVGRRRGSPGTYEPRLTTP